jgi:DUF2075 family protein
MSSRSFYASSLPNFLLESADSIVGKIAQHHSQNLEYLQTSAWVSQIEILKISLALYSSGHIYFEIQIPRMGRRADIVLILDDVLFVIEFKVGAKHYLPADLRQTHGYAIDLHHFHEGSHDKVIVPILLATEAPDLTIALSIATDSVYEPLCANRHNFYQVVRSCLSQITSKIVIDAKVWEASSYKPTPTIIEAATALYADHAVADIARNDAGAQNLNVTSFAIQNIIHSARLNNRKAICFVTGVPGAGKTLVGLNIATSSTKLEQDEHAVFLSGNGPLVEVLTEALARDSVARRSHKTKADALRSAEAKIQNIHKFRDESLKKLLQPPPERVVIFDEAQRAWNLESTQKFMLQKRNQKTFTQSEPEFLIGVMDRHKDWCVIVALIGGGQELNTGEAGLQGWVDALEHSFGEWDVHYSDKLVQIEYAGRDIKFNVLPLAKSNPSLHLATSMRSFRADKLSHMVHYLIHDQSEQAHALYQEFRLNFPVKITRDLKKAKDWIKTQSRANETKGLIASSGAIRLKPEGVFVKNRISAADWFLNAQDDIRSCHFLEDVATEFDIQGLELDWCLVCWDADYRYTNVGFTHWKFTGMSWKQRQQQEQKRYLENAYRVLLTRARQGMVVFVPRGVSDDITRESQFFDGTFHYLLSCGLDELE